MQSGTDRHLYSVHFVNENTGWIVGASGIILKTTTGGEATVVEDMKHKDLILPDNFMMYENYPNPFNSSTKIRFALSNSAHVTIKILDILGKEIETLVHGRYEPGYHDVIWNAENCSSGIYFYVIQADQLIQAKKMMLIK